MSMDKEEVVLYEVVGGIASVTMRRPEFHHAQNSKMTDALNSACRRAAEDDSVKVIVLRGAGKHFAGGHETGTSMRGVEQGSRWQDCVSQSGGEFLYAREQEAFLGMCRGWRELPKPTIAMVQGACIACGLMLASVCDLIVASEDAFFYDPIMRTGVSSIEYFALAYALNPRSAKEFLFLGERMNAQRAYQMGVVNRVVSHDFLEEETYCIAGRIAQIPQIGLALAKQVVNHVEDLQGKRAAMDAAFAWRHFALQPQPGVDETGRRSHEQSCQR